MTLGLVLSPVSGTVSESYATEVSSEKSELNKEEMLGLIKAYIEDFDNFKNTQIYDFAGKDAQNNLSKVIDEAKKVLDKANPSDDDVKKSLDSIEKASQELVDISKKNTEAINKNIKTNLIKVGKLLDKHKEMAGDDHTKGLDFVVKAKEQLKSENFEKAKLEDLVKLDQSLIDFFDTYKNELTDIDEYNVREEEIKELDEEIKKSEIVSDETKYKNLKADFEALANSHESFLKSNKFILGSESLKKAYNEAYKELEKYYGKLIDKATYEPIAKAVKDLADAKYKIDNQDHEYKGIKTGPSAEEIKEKTVETLKKLTDYVKGSRATLEGLKDSDLEKAYKAAIAKAGAYTRNYAKGIPRELKDYQELEAQLKDLTEKINKAKGVKVEENKKIDKLKAVIEKVREFRRTATYESKSKENKDLKDKLEKALIEAMELEDKYDKNPTSVKDEDIDRAIKALEAALDDFYGFNNKDAARKALETLLAKTAGIKIDQIYDTSDQKDAKDAYIKAKDQAAKLVKNKDASVEDMAKAYKDLDDALNKLAEFLNKRLKDLVDDHPKFSESEKYKKVDADVTKDDVILNYLTVLADAKKELDKAAPDANALNNLYKKLKNARDEINGVFKSSWGRKLADAIIDYQMLKNDPKYSARVGAFTGYQSDASESYARYIAKAESLKKAGKLDSEEAKDILDLIEHAKGAIDGNVSKEKYYSNKYYHILKEVKNYENYKKLNQALRMRLEKALDDYEKNNGSEESIFKSLDEVMSDSDVKAIIQEIKDKNDPNKARNDLLIKLRAMAEKSEEFIKDDKYKNAPKELKADYDRALEEAKKVIQAEKPTEKEVKDAYDRLKLAIDRIETRSIIDRRLVVLAENFKKNQLKIANPADRQTIADKINALKDNPYTTIEEVDAVEKELNDLINPKFAATQTLVPQGGVPTTTRPVSTVTNPGSIVKTGINGIAKVAVVLVAALGIYILTSKKGDKK